MKYYVGVTNNNWYDYLALIAPDEVNFWIPSGRSVLKQLVRNDLFLFKLKSPRNAIGGGGFFVDYLRLPLNLAWEVFQETNGTSSFPRFRNLIRSNRSNNRDDNPEIGCVILTEPFFFSEDMWIQDIPNWSPNLQTGRYYDTSIPAEAMLWDCVQQHIYVNMQFQGNYAGIAEPTPAYGQPTLINPRLGQRAFRALVTNAYDRRCAITQERTLPVLEAAHIKPYAKSGTHSIRNGLLIRADMHKLLDKGYITVTRDYHLEVSSRIKEEFHNGREYYRFHGSSLRLPNNPDAVPAQEFIVWHNNNVYRG